MYQDADSKAHYDLFFLFVLKTLSINAPSRVAQDLALLLGSRVVLAPCCLVVDRMAGNAIQQTAAATARVREHSADGAALVCHLELPGAQGGAEQAIDFPDCLGDADADLSSITGDTQPVANRSRQWFQYASVTGWESAQQILVHLSDAQLEGGAWRAGKMAENKIHVVYHFRCPFHYTHGCPWEVRVRIRKNQQGQQEKSAGEEWFPVRMCKTSDERKQEHALHVCDVELDEKFPHADHTGIQSKGPHQFWVCAAEGNPMMYEWEKPAISAWLDAKNVKFGGGHEKNYALERISRHNRIKRAKEKESEWGLQECVSPWTKLTVAADNMHLASVSRKPGFTVDTAYLVPGSVAEDGARSVDAPQLCLMFTTINFVMNLARVQQFHFETKGKIDGAVAIIDHTFKVR